MTPIFLAALALLTWDVLRSLRRVWKTSEVIRLPIVKTCACGRSYTLAQWRCLPFVGIWDLGGGDRAELRNCSCGSSITIPCVVDERDGFELALGSL